MIDKITGLLRKARDWDENRMRAADEAKKAKFDKWLKETPGARQDYDAWQEGVRKSPPKPTTGQQIGKSAVRGIKGIESIMQRLAKARQK